MEPNVPDKITLYKRIKSGRVNRCYTGEFNKKKVFIKFNSNPSQSDILEKEAYSLRWLNMNGIHTPEIIMETPGCMVLSYLKLDQNKIYYNLLAKTVANLHKLTQSDHAGFSYDNYHGPFEVKNTFDTDWVRFFKNTRWIHVINTFKSRDMLNYYIIAMKVNDIIEQLFPEDPYICATHGDFHKDNWGYVDGNVHLFDPALSYAHNEYELASFDAYYKYTDDFINTYDSIIPKCTKLFNERKMLYHSYYYFIGYAMSGEDDILEKCISNMKMLLEKCDKFYPSLSETHLLNPLSEEKPNVVIVYSGSFCPIHKNHIRTLQKAYDHLSMTYNVISAYISLTSDEHLMNKMNPENGTESKFVFKLKDRVKMIKMSLENVQNNFIQLDLSLLGWDAPHDHFDKLMFSHYDSVVKIVILHGEDGVSYYRRKIQPLFPSYDILCMGRAGCENKNSKLNIISNPDEFAMSSTVIRKLLCDDVDGSNTSELKIYLEQNVLDYIMHTMHTS